MKLTTPFLSTLLLLSILLSGCQSQPSTTVHQATPESQKTASAQEEKSTPDSKEPTQEIALADQTAFDGALQLQDENFCNKIENGELKNKCKEEVRDLISFDKALTAQDKNLCKQVINQDKQKACETSIEIGVEMEKKQKKEIEESNARFEQFKQIVSGNDVEKCKTLADVSFKASCEYNLVVNKAIDSKDAKMCDAISSEELKQDCKNTVELNK